MIVGLLVFIAYLYFFVGFSTLFFVLENLNPIDYAIFYSLALAATVTSIFFLSAAWHALLKALSVKASLKSLFLYTWVGSFVDLVVPCQAVCGEVTRIYLVHKENKENYGAIAASSITNRIISYVISSVGLFTGLLLLLTRSSSIPIYVLNLLVLGLVGTAIYLAALFYLAIEERAAEKLAAILFKALEVTRLKRYVSADLPERIQESLVLLHKGFKTFREHPGKLVQPLIFQFLSMILNISVYVLVFYALGFRNLFIDFFIIVYFIVGTIQIAAAVFSVGTLDIVLTNLFVIYGVPIGFSVIAATLLRVLTFWLPVLIGYVTVQVVGARRLLNPNARKSIAAQQNIEGQPTP
jgi:uncharacterized protein (TIRG00374 family)